mmetsp:Transcript_6369/g.16288  ORF Transcript_6369/g.16288 Transcript_6369/m.16288 type:complete len:237 (-) Transcript_6369:399-1109(-)|eukprot:CAMPEP_0119422186 /NCGR_PEP_ID=MMETSP1335-20130426/27618_1 /TAXON_ID=259385 /ORGANISM="Chrysoculter rhomboideus, Strain RCC1486" /LENGTH=236 /DNA_ID=CAMNT_0007447625 /DNA_START=14 /DNA_END=724 /DNA_ORIENTATION=-
MALARTVLVLGGWSPGPLPFIEHAFARDLRFVHVPIPMPPSGLLWMMNPFCFLLAGYLFGLVPWLVSFTTHALEAGAAAGVVVAICIASALICRLLVAALVRYSIADSVWRAQRAIARESPVLVIGFSWGGGVAHWLMAAPARFTGPALLLAPTTAAVRSAALARWPAITASDVEVVHATRDPFCPMSQVAAYRQAGCHVHVVEDEHVLCSGGTVQLILRSVATLSSASRSGERST